MNEPATKVFVLDNTTTIRATNVAGNMNPYFIRKRRAPSRANLLAISECTSNKNLTLKEESFNIAANRLAAKNPKLQKVFRILQRLLQRKQTEMSSVTSSTGSASREQDEPTKPLSAYALFFRDTVSAIKMQQPNCSFQELSKIVASMWDILDPVHKDVYNKKNELARIEYLKQMRIYQQQQLEKQEQQKDINDQQTPANQDTQATPENNSNIQHDNQQVNSNQVTSSNAQTTAEGENSRGSPNESGEVQKCTRENCNKLAIINPDWEDEYCSNECVIIHCRNVFNDWVQSNLEARRQQQQQQMNTV